MDCKERSSWGIIFSVNHDMWWKDIGRKQIDIDDEDNSLSEIINFFYHICKIVQIYNEHGGDIGDESQNHVYNNILHVNEK